MVVAAVELEVAVGSKDLVVAAVFDFAVVVVVVAAVVAVGAVDFDVVVVSFVAVV